MVAEQQPLLYRIEMWDDHDAHVEELIALVTGPAAHGTANESNLASWGRLLNS
jgi:hypothetical protein